jgi:hypothetical protein
MPIIAYRDGSASRLAIKQFNGAIWSDLGNTPTINPLNSALADISLVLDSNDKPYIAYTEFSTDEYGKVITLDENSNDWVTLQASNVPTGIGVRFNSLYLDSQDVLHYAYQRSAVTKCVVYNVPLSIDKVEKDSLMSLYPNPTSNLFSIETNQPIVEVSIYDVQGKKVKTFNQTNTSYNTEGLTSGIYFVNVKTSKGEVTKKLIKE